MKKRKVVLNDKAKIASVIEELDKKKKAALIKAWEQVNKVKQAFIFVFVFLFIFHCTHANLNILTEINSQLEVGSITVEFMLN